MYLLLRSLKDKRCLIEVKLGIDIETSWAPIVVANITKKNTKKIHIRRNTCLESTDKFHNLIW
jgi:hypothetical protein